MSSRRGFLAAGALRVCVVRGILHAVNVEKKWN